MRSYMKTTKLTRNEPNSKRVLSQTFRVLGVFLAAICFVAITNFAPASASSFDYNVNVKPTLSITLSSPTIALRLNPASLNFNTGNVDISVATNNLSGYKLYMGADGDTTNLVNTTDSNYYIETLPTSGTTNCAIIAGGTGGCTESNFPINYWGYRIASGSNTNPDITDTTTGSNSRYFPYIPNTLINSTTSTTNNNTSTLTFAASADYAKPAGTYSLDLNFRTIPIITQVYMQDMTSEQCTEDPTIVIDKRDEQFYTVRKIAGNCWMVDNLRLGYNSNNPNTTALILTPEDSNVTETRSITAYDLVTYGGDEEKCGGGFRIDGKAYINTCIHSKNIETNDIGVWYNYALVTAGTIADPADSTNVTEATESICPKGWKLPDLTQIRSIGTNTAEYVEPFNPVSGGYYENGVNFIPERGYFWGATAENGRSRYYLAAYDVPSVHLGSYYSIRSGGRYVRCVLSE